MANLDQTLISVIRRVYPQIIANDIIGAQPMTGSFSQIFRTRYDPAYQERYAVPKELYSNFLRLNNRRKTQSLNDFKVAKYSGISVDWDHQVNERIKWLDENIGEGKYFYVNHTLFFCDEKYKAMYLLRWA